MRWAGALARAGPYSRRLKSLPPACYHLGLQLRNDSQCQSPIGRTSLAARQHQLRGPAAAVVEIFLFVIWIWILFTIIGDLFRDHEMSGWAKAPGSSSSIFIPFLADAHLPDRPRLGDARPRGQGPGRGQAPHGLLHPAAGAPTPADELHKLHDLKEKGALSAEEFDRAKAKLLA